MKQEKWAILFTQKDAHKCDEYSYELDAHVVNALEQWISHTLPV